MPKESYTLVSEAIVTVLMNNTTTDQQKIAALKRIIRVLANHFLAEEGENINKDFKKDDDDNDDCDGKVLAAKTNNGPTPLIIAFA
jgi:hypothetical protein